MDEFFDQMQHLRDAVALKATAKANDWNTLTSSMDALEDAHWAVSAFVAAVSKPELQERELGERYLRMYGVMQAFAIQQDSISNFYVALGMSKPDMSPLLHHSRSSGCDGWPSQPAGKDKEPSTKVPLHFSDHS